MKNSMFAALGIIAAAVMCGSISCMRAELKAASAMTINDVSIASVPDGSYTGSYTYGDFTYAVRCVVADGRVDKIKVLQNRSSSWGKKAEGVVRKVIEQQRVTIDAVSGATASSKALLKAIEKALTKGSSSSN